MVKGWPNKKDCPAMMQAALDLRGLDMGKTPVWGFHLHCLDPVVRGFGYPAFQFAVLKEVVE